MTHLIILFPGDSKAAYKDLNGRISGFGQSVKIGEFCWAVNSTKSADQLRDDLIQYTDRDIDRMLVCEMKCWSHYNFPQSIEDKLNK